MNLDCIIVYDSKTLGMLKSKLRAQIFFVNFIGTCSSQINQGNRHNSKKKSSTHFHQIINTPFSQTN